MKKKLFDTILSIVIILTMLSAMPTVSFAESPEPPSGGGGGYFEFFPDIDIQLGHYNWIEKEDTRYEYMPEEVLVVDVDVTDFTVDDDSLVAIYEDDDSWGIYGEKVGKTTANISYNYSYTNGDGIEVSCNAQEEFDINVCEYGVSLRIDSPSNTILPGESIRLVASVEKAVSTEDGYEYEDVSDVVNLQLETVENYSFDNGEAIDESIPIMSNPVNNENNSWIISAKVLNGEGSSKKEGEATYRAVVKVGNEEVAKSYPCEMILVRNQYFEIHNKGDFEDGGTNEPRELLVGHTINACCSGDGAEFEIWERKYGQADGLLNVDNADVSEFEFWNFDYGMFTNIVDEDYNTVGLKVVNYYNKNLPYEDTIRLSVRIDENYYQNTVPVKVNGFKMKYEGENIKSLDNGSYGSDVFLSSDAINPSCEVKIKASPDCTESELSAGAYTMEYTLGYYYGVENYDYNDNRYREITGNSGTVDEDGYYCLNYQTLKQLNDYLRDSVDEEGCVLVLNVRAVEKIGDATGDGAYATDIYPIFINESTLFEYFRDEYSDVLPGDVIFIRKEEEANFNNESVDNDYANYSIIDAPTISSDANNWYTIQNKDDGWFIEISSSADAISKRATVNFNYIIEGTNIERRHSFEINVVDKILSLEYETDRDTYKMIFGSKIILSPMVEYSYYDSYSQQIISQEYPENNIDGLNLSMERTYSEYEDLNESNSPYGGYTKDEKNGNKWTVAAISPEEYGAIKPRNGSDYYKLTATLGDLSASCDEIEFYVRDEYYMIEKKNNDMKLNVQTNKTIKLSDFALYRHYLKDTKTNNTWEGRELATIDPDNDIYQSTLDLMFESFDEDIFDINEASNTLTVKNNWNDFPVDRTVGITTLDEWPYEYFTFAIVNEQVAPLNPGGNPTGNEGILPTEEQQEQAEEVSGEPVPIIASKPVKTAVKKFKALKKAIIVTWNNKDVDGYQIQYSTFSNFKKGKNTKKIYINNSKTVSKKISKLKSKKKYYVRIRTFKKAENGKQYSAWSKAKSVKTK